jgi:hypothetical protein
MDTRKKAAALWLAWLVVGALVGGGCATSSSSRREDAPQDSEMAEKQPDESAYRDAALKFLKYLDAQREAGKDVIQASGKSGGIYPMYECMEYGCPDRVFCKDIGAYCVVTHCGKGGCRGCDEPFPEIFKNLVFKQWCRFDCLKGSVRAGSALGFIPSIGNFFIGPYCLRE